MDAEFRIQIGALDDEPLISTVASYRKFYAQKAIHSFVMKWRRAEHMPCNLKIALSTHFPGVEVMKKQLSVKKNSSGKLHSPIAKLGM